MKQFPIGLALAGPLPEPADHIAHGTDVHDALSYRKGKGRPLPVDTLYIEMRIHERQELPDNAHPEPRSLNGAIPLLLDPGERREKLFHILFLHADAGVGDLKAKTYLILPDVEEAYLQAHLALLRVFDGIRQKI